MNLKLFDNHSVFACLNFHYKLFITSCLEFFTISLRLNFPDCLSEVIICIIADCSFEFINSIFEFLGFLETFEYLLKFKFLMIGFGYFLIDWDIEFLQYFVSTILGGKNLRVIFLEYRKWSHKCYNDITNFRERNKHCFIGNLSVILLRPRD